MFMIYSLNYFEFEYYTFLPTMDIEQYKRIVVKMRGNRTLNTFTYLFTAGPEVMSGSHMHIFLLLERW